jgi:hypothetical protein
MNWLIKLFKKSRMGALGSLIYLWNLISIGILDAFQFESGMFDLFLLKQFPQNVSINKVIGDMFLTFNSIHFGLLFFLGTLIIFYHPFVSFWNWNLKLAKNQKRFLVVSSIWSIWAAKMLLIGTLIEQATVWLCRAFFVVLGLTSIDLSARTFYLWVSGAVTISFPRFNGIIFFNIIVIIALIVLSNMENPLRKRWKFHK